MQINSMASLYQLFQSLSANGNKNRSQTTSGTQTPPLSPQAFVNLFGGLPFDPSMFAGGNFPGVSFRSTGNGDGGGGGGGGEALADGGCGGDVGATPLAAGKVAIGRGGDTGGGVVVVCVGGTVGGARNV